MSSPAPLLLRNWVSFWRYHKETPEFRFNDVARLNMMLAPGLFVVLAITLTVGYFTWKLKVQGADDPDDQEDLKRVGGFKRVGNTRNIVEHVKDTGKNCVIFFGSQTGMAQDLAMRLAKEGSARYGLQTLVADLEDYDYDSLATFPVNKVAIFVLATYGEGEPTDNAVDFYEFITQEKPEFSTDGSMTLACMRYAVFGLGNSSYEHYNAVARKVDRTLATLGAQRLCEAGEGDDGGDKSLEEDFLSWKATLWASVAAAMGLQEREIHYEPMFTVTETDDVDPTQVYLGELSRSHLLGQNESSAGPHNPFIAPVVESRELFRVQDRNCLHVEFDISNSPLSYTSGDHLAVWPMNPDEEVDRFLKVFGLHEKRHRVIEIGPVDPSTKVPIPTPTTYDAMVRYYLEIHGPVSRELVSTLAPSSPNEAVRTQMTKLGNDREYFSQAVSSRYLTLAQLLEQLSPQQPFTQVPVSALIEGIRNLQPRYYSISSSPLVKPDRVSITAVVECLPLLSESGFLKGVATNYLLDRHMRRNPQHEENGAHPSYQIDGPRNKYHFGVPVHIRSSNFRLPADNRLPVVMVGPGTGLAPFRGFIQERAARRKSGNDVGKMLLFFGCRKRTEDFIYEEEWTGYKEILGDKFDLVTAFSREGNEKVYVQHRMQEKQSQIYDLLIQKKAHFYVCGDARNMARQVHDMLAHIIASGLNAPISRGEEIVQEMRASGRYMEDAWA